MITISEFFRKYYNKSVEYDNVARYQCVDYIKQYLFDHLGISPGSWGDAKQYYKRFNDPTWAGYKKMQVYFIRIPGAKDIQKGDIVVWDGEYGHVAIANGEIGNDCFYAFEQNFAGKKKVTKNKHFRSDDILGVLRPTWNVVTEDLNRRIAPSSNARIIDELPEGDFVRWTETKGNWKKIGDGWCFAKYLD